MCPAYALREEYAVTREVPDGQGGTIESPVFLGGLLAGPEGDFDVAAELAAGDGVIVVPDEQQSLTELLDRYTALKRVPVPDPAGVDPAKGYDSYSLNQLRTEAARRGLTGLSSKTKQDVIAALEQSDNPPQSEGAASSGETAEPAAASGQEG